MRKVTQVSILSAGEGSQVRKCEWGKSSRLCLSFVQVLCMEHAVFVKYV
jgi:hypothetical protein